MQDFFCDIYSSIRDKNPVLKRLHIYSICRWLTRQIANIVLPTLRGIRPSNVFLQEKRNPSIIVSLTSFPARINNLWLVIDTMLRQTIQPDKIILWLSKKQFPDMKSVPNNLIRLQERGLEIRLVPDDLRSHKKYVYALREFPDDVIITIDDDIIYRSTMIAELWATHQSHPQAVIAQYTHNMLYDNDGSLLPYNQWENNTMRGSHLFFGSGGGTLFPPHSLHADVMDEHNALAVCPNADDIWLNAMARLAKTPIVHSNRYTVVLPILNRNSHTLSADNITNGNDIQLHQVIDYCKKHYGVNPFAK